jgi:serine/threonine-protein kinase
VRICPRCHTTVADDVSACPNDGRRPVTREVFEAVGHDPLLGATIAGRYTIVGRLGAGGMGTVYRAEQAPLGREVALKVLRKELGRDPETVARFTREAKLLSQLRHPNTVAILDFGQSEEGLLFLAMELLEGEMLSVRLRKRGALPVEEATRITAGVLRSLDEAHARGIVHRDLKPDNIFLARVHGRPEDAEVVKVVDFGIAKIRDGDQGQGLDPVATQEGTVFGTPRYMSPEQAQGRSIDGRSDLYAVGVLLFHMLTGQPPFTDDDAVIVMAHHIKTEPPGVRSLAPESPIPESLEILVARALAKNPDDRPQTAQDFLTELEALGPDITEAAQKASFFTEETAVITIDPPSRRAWIGVVMAATAVATLLGVAVTGVQRNRADSRVALRSAPPAADARASTVLPPPTVPAAPVAVTPSPTPAHVLVDVPSGPSSGRADDDGHDRHSRRTRQTPRTRALRPQPTSAPAMPTSPTAQVPQLRRDTQPYGTFDGM